MTIQQQLQLSYYREVAAIHEEHGIFLVQDQRSGKFFVKKVLDVFNLDVYRYLLNHPIPNTPRIYLLIQDGKQLIVIEEYIHGDTLEELLAPGPLPEAQVIDIAISLCSILEAFHSCDKAIVNRDIKPSNIKITPDGVVKLVDLNAAKFDSAEASRDTVLIGTQGYAAPEQYGFGASSVLTDIYAMGILMNVMLTGTFPQIRPASGRLKHIIARCVELSPKSRPQSIRALRDSLLALQKPKETKSSPRGWQRCLPPGFRGKNPFVWLFSAVGYLFLFGITMSLQVSGGSPVSLWVNRLCATFGILLILLFSGNYLDMQRFVPLPAKGKKLLRFLAIAGYDCLILFAFGFLCSIFESYLLS